MWKIIKYNNNNNNNKIYNTMKIWTSRKEDKGKEIIKEIK